MLSQVVVKLESECDKCVLYWQFLSKLLELFASVMTGMRKLSFR